MIISFLNVTKGAVFSFTAFVTATVLWLSSFFVTQVFADGLSNSKFVTRTTTMLGDATNVLIILAPVITIFVIGYCFIRKGAADEMGHKKWNTRITTALVCCYFCFNNCKGYCGILSIKNRPLVLV